MDREAWRAAIHGFAKSRTRLSDWTELNCVTLIVSFSWLLQDPYFASCSESVCFCFLVWIQLESVCWTLSVWQLWLQFWVFLEFHCLMISLSFPFFPETLIRQVRLLALTHRLLLFFWILSHVSAFLGGGVWRAFFFFFSFTTKSFESFILLSCF